MVLTKYDLLYLEDIALYLYYGKEVHSLLESYNLHSRLVERVILEQMSKDITDKEAKELDLEFKEDIKEMEHDDVFSGVARIAALIDKTKRMYIFLTGSVAALPVRWLVGKVWKWRKTKLDIQDFASKQEWLEKAKKLAIKEGKPTDPKTLAQLATQIKYQTIMSEKQENLKKLQLVGGIWSKLRAKILKIWLKVHPEKVSYKLAESIDKLLALCAKHPFLTPVVVALVMAIILTTIFKWNTIKKYFRLLARLILSPFRLFGKFLRWLFSKLRIGIKTAEQT